MSLIKHVKGLMFCRGFILTQQRLPVDERDTETLCLHKRNIQVRRVSFFDPQSSGLRTDLCVLWCDGGVRSGPCVSITTVNREL